MVELTFKGEPALFLPGSGGRRAFWEPVAARLTCNGPHVFFAWPAFGDEPADPTIQSLEDLHLSTVGSARASGGGGACSS